MDIESYPTIEAFYDAHEAARSSGESDYGCWWRDDDGGVWRVSYVHDTGHVYAICQNRTGRVSQRLQIGGEVFTLISAHDGDTEGPVIIIGKLDVREDVGFETLDVSESILHGWADVCGSPGSLRWVVERLAPVLT